MNENADSTSPRQGELIAPGANHLEGHATATMVPQSPAVAVQFNANNLNIQPSSLSALEKIGQSNPDLANKIVDATTISVRLDSRNFITAVLVTATICLALIICSTAIILQAGVSAGIAFFLVCAAVAAIVGAVITGKSPDLSWTVGFVSGQSTASKSLATTDTDE